MNHKTAIYPGTFDPITYGHLDVIQRAAGLYDRLIVAVADNKTKSPLFSHSERLTMVQAQVVDWPNVEVLGFDGLLVEFAKQHNAAVILRGLRAVSDFEFEIQMAAMNRALEPTIETIFLSPANEYAHLSSTMVRDVAKHGGVTRSFVPDQVTTALQDKYNRQSDTHAD